MIRKYNYTGRLKIAKELIKIKQVVKNGVKVFEVNLQLGDLGFPDHAKIYIEPYFKSSFMRFDFGTIARTIQPENTILSDIPISDRIQYRVKIVDESNGGGLILGFAEELVPSTGSEVGKKISLLPVDFNDLGNRIWKLDFREEGPVLSVNWDNKIEKIRDFVGKDEKFLCLVYSEVIRQIAFEIASDEDLDFSDPGEGWQSRWLNFFDKVLNISYLPDKSDVKDQAQWSDDISDAFCRKENMLKILSGLN